jgi:hypothetical protein
MSMPGFSALAAIPGNHSTNTRTSGLDRAQIALRSPQPAQIVAAIPGPGFNPGVCLGQCMGQCREKGGSAERCGQICEGGCHSGGGGYPGPGSGASGTCFKNSSEGLLCCGAAFTACALLCTGTTVAILACEAACGIGAAACVNCQVWPCSLL